MPTLTHRAQYIYVRTLVAVMQALPWGVARRIAHAMAWISWKLDRPYRKKEAAENLRLAFPEMSEQEARRTVRRVYYHLADSVLDWLKLAKLASRPDVKDLFDVVGREKLQDFPPGQPFVFATGHFGDWEALGIAASLMGYPIWAVGRSFDNELIDAYVNSLRGATGGQVVSKHGAMLQVFRILAEGTNVAILIDQDARRHGIFVDFFGRPASTTDLAARLCLRTGAPAVFVYAHRIPGQNRFRIVCADVVRPQTDADPQDEVHRITQRLTWDLEEAVRQMPEQWLWLHRRWKTQPGGRGAPQQRPAPTEESADAQKE